MLTSASILIVLLFASMVFAFGRGVFRVALALGLALFSLGYVLPAAALAGWDPLAVSLAIAAVFAAAGCPLVGGWNRKSIVAALSSCAAMALAAVLPTALDSALGLTGMEAHFGPRPHLETLLWYHPALAQVRFAELHLGAVIVAAVGAVMDTAMTVCSAVDEAGRAGSDAGFARRWRMGMRVGARVLGPMMVTMLLIFAGTDIASFVARAASPGADWAGWWTLLDYESVASETLRSLAAAFGLMACVPVAALFSAWLLGRGGWTPSGETGGCLGVPPAAPGLTPATSEGNASAAVKKKAWPVGAVAWRLAAAAALVSVGFGLEGAALRHAGRARVLVESPRSVRDHHAEAAGAGEEALVRMRQAVRTQETLGRVLFVESPVVLEADPAKPYNPARGPLPDALEPAAALAMTGENRGRVLAFVNRIQPRPFVNVPLRAGGYVRLMAEVRDGTPAKVRVLGPPVRWRGLLWGAVAVGVAMVCGFGLAGFRAGLLALCAAVLLGFAAFPLMARGVAPVGAALLALAGVAAALAMFWGLGARATAAALLGASAGIASGGAVAFLGVRLFGLTGAESALVSLLRMRPALSGLDFRQIMVAGVTLMAAGAALDIGASVVGGLAELRRHRPDADSSELRRAGTRISRGVTATMILTLVFAWLAGLGQPLLLLVGSPEMLTREWMKCYAAEGVQAAAAAVALAMAGPCTALAYSLLFRKPQPVSEGHPVAPASRPSKVTAAALAALLAAGAAGAISAAKHPDPPWRRTGTDVALHGHFHDGKAPWLARPALREDEARHWRSLAQGRIEAGDGNGAAVLLWRARRSAPGDPGIERDLAYVAVALRWFDLARDSLSRALPELEHDPVARYVRGVLAIWEGDADLAVSELEEALRLEPGFAPAREALRSILE